MKRVLTDKLIQSLRPAEPGKRYVVADAIVPGLLVRVTQTGHKTFALGGRLPGEDDYKRIELGEVGTITLADVRDKARAWLQQVKAGLDPRVAEAERRRAAEAQAESTFGALCERFIARVLPRQRNGRRVERRLRRDVIPVLGGRSVASITHRDVRAVIARVVERGSRRIAHNVFDDVRAVCAYAVETEALIEVSPCAGVRPMRLIGPKATRERVLSDAELGALWRAGDAIGYPFGRLAQMMVLTGCRLNECSGARWREFSGDVWVIPPARFKSNATHVVPVTRDLRALLDRLPTFRHSDYLFTARGGRPVAGFNGDARNRLGELMAEELGEVEPFVMHDLRRSLRSGLSQMRVPDAVAELCIGHGRRGLQRVYDRHAYTEEVREAMERWCAKLRAILGEGGPENVVAGPWRSGGGR